MVQDVARAPERADNPLTIWRKTLHIRQSLESVLLVAQNGLFFDNGTSKFYRTLLLLLFSKG